ncbi:AraC family transcriptional regulator [Staphylococcus debuckii]|uniref:AraC family ligand binding domain-containing protein n=1 Tax=Staphylococcus debuckii TaxID=2044912 RepID=A0ABU9EZV8_9STAP
MVVQLLWKKFVKENFEFNIDECGIELGTPNVGYTYTVTKTAVLHVITHGTGTFRYQGRTYHLEKGDIFLLKEGMEVSYTAAKNNPWTYFWVGLSGKQALNYLSRSSIVDNVVMQQQNIADISRVIQKICHTAERMQIEKSDDIKLNQYVFELLYDLQKTFPKKFTYTEPEVDPKVQIALQFMNQNYKHAISVNKIADAANVSRSYLYKTFRKYFNTSPKDYLHHLRMYHASQHLIHTQEPIYAIAEMVGYHHDPLIFSRAFKRHFNMNPSEYRNIYSKLHADDTKPS